MTIDHLYKLYKESPFVCTDTRQIVRDSLFFALKGERFNANKLAGSALEAGARWAVVDDPDVVTDDRYILVDDVLTTLQALARHHRQQLTIPFIGITGTNGKTTTKELVYAVLSQQYKTYATKGNLNNHIGVPLTLLAIDDSVEMAVIEMGANHQSEIGFLCGMAQPTHGLITNVGKAHLEGFGSFEGVKKAKGELYDFLKAHDGVLFLQGDNAHLVEMESGRSVRKIFRYGFSASNDIVGELAQANPFLTVRWREKEGDAGYPVETHLTGSYNTENILAAVAVGRFFGMEAALINAGIEAYHPTNNRSQIVETDRNTVIADYYNANASSMAAALENIAVINAERKVIILGDMFEMGDETYEEHRRIVEKATALGVERMLFIGKAFFEHRCPQGEFYRTTDEAKEQLRQRPVENSTVLLKASRGMAFESLVELL